MMDVDMTEKEKQAGQREKLIQIRPAVNNLFIVNTNTRSTHF